VSSDLACPHPDRRPLFRFAAPSKPFEPLVLVAALACVVLHWLVISAANELAWGGGQCTEELGRHVYRLRYLGAATAALGFLALLRIWWRGFTRQGLVLAFYTVVVGLCVVWLLVWWWSPRVVDARWFFEGTAIFKWFSFGVLGGAVLVHEWLRRRERRREPARPHVATRRLVVWLAVATSLCSGAFLAAEWATRARVRDVYADYLPSSSTAEVPLDGFVLDNLLGGVLTVGPEGEPLLDTLELLVERLREEASFQLEGGIRNSLQNPYEDVFDDEPRLPSSSTEVARAYLEGEDYVYRQDVAWSFGVEDGPIPDDLWREERTRWWENSLFVALAPDRKIGELAALLDWAREIRPEQSAVMLLCSRSWPLDDVGLLVRGLRRLPFSVIPIELEPIPGATEVKASFSEEWWDTWFFEIDEEVVEALSGPWRQLDDLGRELERRGTGVVNLEMYTKLPYRRLITVLDALRARGIERVALRPDWP